MNNEIQTHINICRKPVDNHFTWQIPNDAKVKIHGFVMLKGLEDGKAFIIKRDEDKKIYWFCVPRTGRKVIGHYMSEVDHNLQCFTRGDGNCIQVISA